MAPSSDTATIARPDSQLRRDAARCLVGAAIGSNYFHPDGPYPIFERASGSRLYDSDGREYVDYCIGSGAMFLGHAHPAVTNAIADQAARGTHFVSTVNVGAVNLAKAVMELVPSAQKVRFTTSGSEATFHALRLCRAYTGRKKVLKFEGAFHGNHDYAQQSMAPAGPSVLPRAKPDSAGIPEEISEWMIIAPYNDIGRASQIIADNASDLAAIVAEPIQRNIHPKPGFLEGLREAATRYGIPLVFDEVISGFRYGTGGAQQYYGVTPDLTTLGKILGGGTPVSAIVGRADIMESCSPDYVGSERFVYVNGTLYGNPLGCAAGLATLNELRSPGFYEPIFELGRAFLKECQQLFLHHQLHDTAVFGDGVYVDFAFGAPEPTNYQEYLSADLGRRMRLHTELMAEGIFVDPGKRMFLSAAHTPADIEITLRALDRVLGRMHH